MTIPFETHVYKVAQGCEIRADVYLAPARSRPSPAILLIHGGALIMGSRQWANLVQVDAFTGSGHTVVSVDYRLAPETKLPAIVADVRDAYRWLRESGPGLFGVDAERIAVMGSSAGGYLALMTGFSVSPRPRALVSFYGYGDIVGDWYSSPDPFYCQQPAVTREQAYGSVGERPICESGEERAPFYLYCRQQGLWPQEVGGHDPRREAFFFRPFCPVQNVSSDYPPTLLLHGDADTDVPYEQSVLMARALAGAGVRSELITIANGAHGFDQDMADPAVQAAMESSLSFLGTHLAA